MHEALCRSSGTTLDSVHAEDGPPITQRTSGLILLRHNPGLLIVGLRVALQHGHRSRLLVSATVMCRELGTCRSGGMGGTAGSVTSGNGRFLEVRNGTSC